VMVMMVVTGGCDCDRGLVSVRRPRPGYRSRLRFTGVAFVTAIALHGHSSATVAVVMIQRTLLSAAHGHRLVHFAVFFAISTSSSRPVALLTPLSPLSHSQPQNV